VVATDPDGVEIPANAPSWVRDAVRFLEGGWNERDVWKHIGKHRQTVNTTFRRLGLPPARKIRRAALYRRFERLADSGYSDIDIATETGASETTVRDWRTCMENTMPYTPNSLITIRKKRSLEGPEPHRVHNKQLKLL
jgi:hypothetical protein